MKIHFRTYCYGCRVMSHRHLKRSQCVFRQHEYRWEYFIEESGVRLVTRGPFRTYDRAWKSAERQWHKLSTALAGIPVVIHEGATS